MYCYVRQNQALEKFKEMLLSEKLESFFEIRVSVTLLSFIFHARYV